MGDPKLHVVFYRPRYGNFQHWALYMQTDHEDFVFEVTGSHPDFQSNVARTNPQDSADYVEKMFLSMLGVNDLPRVQRVVQATHVDNTTLEWDCQEYVIDILDTLEYEFILDPDDEEYREAKDEVKRRRGAVD